MFISRFNIWPSIRCFICSAILLSFISAELVFFSPITVHAFSVKEEREYGDKMLAVIRKELKLIDELDVAQYVNELGDSILAVSGPQYFDYHFYVIADKEFNAFATPSGLIFFHSGIINAMNNEGELVSVLAHECGHVMSRHIASRIEKSTKVNAATLAMMMAGIALGGGALSQALVTGGMATGAALNLEYSRQDEEEADRIGFKLMVDQQRDPKDMVSMLNTMYKRSKITMGNVPQYLLTHPMPKLRMSYVQDLIHVKADDRYKRFDQFAFRRMQKRVESLTVEPQKLFGRYNKEIRNSQDEDVKIMATYGLALADFSIGNYGKAIDRLREVINHYPEEPILLTDLGRVYLMMGQLSTALLYLEDARSKSPGDWYSAFFLAKALQQSGNKDRAETLYNQVLGYFPDYPGAYFELAQLASEKGDQRLAHFNLGKRFYYEGNFPVSTYHFKKALELSTEKDKEEIKQMLAKIKDVE